MYTVIAIHYAAPEHADAFLAYMRRVIDATSGAPGLVEFTAQREPNGAYLAGFSRWESEEAFRAALSRIGSLAGERKPEWSVRPDERIVLTDA